MGLTGDEVLTQVRGLRPWRAGELIIDLSGKPLHAAQHGLPLPAARFLSWHGTEVFSGEARTPAEHVLAAEGRGPLGGSHE